ncbi:MAG: hypothetical protein Q7S33_05825 [Nanoarchaeota archaeon]|nr:hypothetical protein [Nanoarchaeota archaeon]
MIKEEHELKEFLQNIKEENISFKEHFYDKKKEDRLYLDEKLIINSLKDTTNFQGFQGQIINNEERYRIGVKLSNKYSLVIISKIEGKNLYIITAWKTNRKWQKAIQK